ncbi:hypothetical protein MASR1M45_11690 [Candidatus Kapaibacterium sp.]
MKNIITAYIIFLFITSTFSIAQTSSDYTVELARKFSRDLFETNGVPFMEPVVRVINSTSNSRFFTSAYIPQKSDKMYFKVGIHGMSGIVNDELKNYTPVMPAKEFDLNEVGKFINYNPITNQITKLDTASLIHYLFLNMMYDGTKGNNKGLIQVPGKASTALGTGNTQFLLPHSSMDSLFRSHPLYDLPLIPQFLKDSVMAAIYQFPEVFTLYGGTNLNYVFAAIPQIEIGSFYGTEILLRVIPPVNLGETIGDFAFWGIGIKHSLSQYFNDEYDNNGKRVPVDERPFDVAAQFVYQGTYLENTVGVTKAELTANANIFSFNLSASKSFKNIIDIYSGFSFETITIKSEYVYLLPVEIQWQLGLLEKPNHGSTPGFPGDKQPQKTNLTVSSDNFRWTIGVVKPIGDFDIFVDYSVSRFDILSAGLQYRF